MTRLATFKINQHVRGIYSIGYIDPESGEKFAFNWNTLERNSSENEQTAGWLTYLCGRVGITGAATITFINKVDNFCKNMAAQGKGYAELTVNREEIE